MNILVTGGTGYIGSHVTVELLNAGHQVICVDNLSNSSKKVLERIEKITGKKPIFYELDVRDGEKLNNVFEENKIDSVIHFAAFKAVGESVNNPLAYYRNNVGGLLSVLECMRDNAVKQLIFSSSCTIYGEPKKIPLTEDLETTIELPSPYGKTKAVDEQILKDAANAYPELQITSLRYFNPIGAHESGLIGEDPSGVPDCLMPFITQVAVGKLEKLMVFGNDYPTPDGTCIRDYIHVVDLALGHLAALERRPSKGEVAVYNLGTGKGTSVLELVHAFEEATGLTIPREITTRRSGDITVSYADPSKAFRELNWKTHRDIKQMCADAWRWQQQNPNGFAD